LGAVQGGAARRHASRGASDLRRRGDGTRPERPRPRPRPRHGRRRNEHANKRRIDATLRWGLDAWRHSPLTAASRAIEGRRCAHRTCSRRPSASDAPRRFSARWATSVTTNRRAQFPAAQGAVKGRLRRRGRGCASARCRATREQGPRRRPITPTRSLKSGQTTGCRSPVHWMCFFAAVPNHRRVRSHDDSGRASSTTVDTHRAARRCAQSFHGLGSARRAPLAWTMWASGCCTTTSCSTAWTRAGGAPPPGESFDFAVEIPDGVSGTGAWISQESFAAQRGFPCVCHAGPR
jgi:hypothetical protein